MNIFRVHPIIHEYRQSSSPFWHKHAVTKWISFAIQFMHCLLETFSGKSAVALNHGKRRWATAWTQMNPDSNWDDMLNQLTRSALNYGYGGRWTSGGMDQCYATTMYRYTHVTDPRTRDTMDDLWVVPISHAVLSVRNDKLMPWLLLILLLEVSCYIIKYIALPLQIKLIIRL